ncbi:MAG: ribulose-phosphate 3-epimerase [Candidatus Marinimicrobia bacterium]|nr:ribulose-phosphate 3-epimerase [Candidatus Neomarinimicrobiota bacterium]MCF7904583.1 ribulose-phosphate 3-epimerase [Candidatus Neomarinimicrobiota bacterium]
MATDRKQQISPSILSADFAELGDQVRSVIDAGCQVLHLDVMDGQYVPNISFGPMVVKAVRSITDVHLESHLMIAEPDKYIENFIRAGSDTVLVHPSTCRSVGDTLARIHDLGSLAGLVINPDEALELTLPYIDQLDQVLIMSVFPGFGGQTFISSVLDPLSEILDTFKKNDILIEIDGGINRKTLPALTELGLDRFVAGSAVFNKQSSPAENYTELTSLLHSD